MSSLIVDIEMLKVRMNNFAGLFDAYIDMKKDTDKLKKHLDKNEDKGTDKDRT